MSGQERGNRRKKSTRLKWTDSNSNSKIPIRKSKRKTKPIDRMEMVMETVINQIMDENKARTKNEIQGEIFCYAALYPTDTEVN